MSQPTLTVAVAQSAFAPGARAANLDKMAALAAKAADAGAALLVYPELATCGYGAGETIRDLAEPPAGPSQERMAQVAAAHGLALCYGYPERSDDALYNSAILIGPDGRTLANHRKTHLFGDYERALFVPGDRAVTQTELGGFKVALLICYEVEFPELARTSVLAGAELLAVPTATALHATPSSFSRIVVASRATENNVFVAYANHCGDDGRYHYNGESIIAGPLTDIYALADGEDALLTAELSRARMAEAEAIAPYRRDRRPELYEGL